ncbi:MAG: glycogen/starch synthase, partial [Candidatus Omnitrophica bacterium]|nr:glycogen/starch synthase [Candidatus Omnitrophota bacterium]
MKIAMCASEMVPFAKTGGLADVAGALPFALESLGHEVIVILPGYRCIRQAKLKLHQAKEGISYVVIGNNIRVYFIENDVYFDRENLYGDKTGDYKDNLKRFSFYSKKSLDLLSEINFKPDIIHVHDWQACLVPVYLKTLYKDKPFYRSIRTVLTVHNIGYQGLFLKEEFPTLELDWSFFNMEMLEYYDKINVLKGGMVFSDVINTVSRTYSKEIQTKEF